MIRIVLLIVASVCAMPVGKKEKGGPSGRDLAESSARMRAELGRRRSQKQETIRPRYTLVRDFDDLCP